MFGRLMCLIFGHKSDQVWMNYALGLVKDNPDRPGTVLPTELWKQFGEGDIYLCPRCRTLFMPLGR